MSRKPLLLHGQGIYLYPLLLVALFLSACQGYFSSDIVASEEGSGILASSNEDTEPTIPPPSIVTVAAPQEQKSFVLPEGKQSAGAPSATTELSTKEASVISSEDPGSTAIEQKPTPTAMPTYTPPPAPESGANEHLWLYRPVPQGSTVWTDKAYPYGATRGGTLRPHHGVEFNVPAKTEVMAAASGTVRIAGDDTANLLGALLDFYGNAVVIEHDFLHQDQSVFTLYGHLSEVLVEEGQRVKAQDVIALSGSTGVADGAHLHFEVRVGQNDYQSTRNPLLWLYPFTDRGVVAGHVTWPDGTPAAEVPISLRRLDAPSPYAASTTYAAQGLNPDDGFRENFALDDVGSGFYKLTAGAGDEKAEVTFWVYPYQTSFVEIQLGQQG